MTRKLNVLHLTYDMGLGGTEQVIRNLVENTDSDRFKSTILCLDGCIGPLGLRLKEQGFELITLNRNPGFDLQLLKQLRSLITQLEVDILHCHQYTPYSYGVLAAYLKHTKVIFTEHGRFYPDQKRLKRLLINPFLGLITHSIVSISKATKDALVNYEYFRRKQIKVIYNGTQDFNPTDDSTLNSLRIDLGLDDASVILGTVSRLDPIKNQKLMLTAFSEITQKIPAAKLLIVGDGPLRGELEDMVKTLRLGRAVVFTGFQVNPQPYMELMDIFLLPSLSEGTSMTLLEAMSLSIPCAVTNAGGNPEIIINEVTGFVTPNDDMDEFKQAVLKLIGDDKTRKKMGENARKRYQELFTVDAMSKRYESLYLNDSWTSQ